MSCAGDCRDDWVIKFESRVICANHSVASQRHAVHETRVWNAGSLKGWVHLRATCRQQGPLNYVEPGRAKYVLTESFPLDRSARWRAQHPENLVQWRLFNQSVGPAAPAQIKLTVFWSAAEMTKRQVVGSLTLRVACT